MSKFKIVKKINLSSVLGEGHEQSYLSFKPMTFADARQLQKLQDTTDYTPELPELAEGATPAQKAKHEKQVKQLLADAENKRNDAALKSLDKVVAFIQAKFIEGNIGGEVVSKDDFTNDELPAEVINYCMQQLAGGGQPEGFTKG